MDFFNDSRVIYSFLYFPRTIFQYFGYIYEHIRRVDNDSIQVQGCSLTPSEIRVAYIDCPLEHLSWTPIVDSVEAGYHHLGFGLPIVLEILKKEEVWGLGTPKSAQLDFLEWETKTLIRYVLW